MNRRRPLSDLTPRQALLVIAAMLWPLCLPAADILRAGRTTTRAPDSAATADTAAPATVNPAAAAAIVTPTDRLARTAQSLNAVRQMQQAARDLAKGSTGGLKPGLSAVPTNSFGVANGLVVAKGVPKDLKNPTADEIAALWTGAQLPTVATKTENGLTTSEVTIKQDAQQALLNWETFNIGRDTTLTFDQSLGGANAGQWIAFNFVRDKTAAPTQILGSIRTIGQPDAKGNAQVGGQVYVMNANGIIFGGTSQVNTHALVASTLPINYNLIRSGLLNNPDAQFLFSAKALAAGNSGPTPAFDPASGSADGSVPVQTSYRADGRYGDVEVQAGAQISAPTNADQVGGRIALIGANVTNAGTLSSPDGQTILAAGEQVGLVAHAASDPTLRGLDVFVGAVDEGSGTVRNDRKVNADGSVYTGLITAPRGAITLTGKTIEQMGFLDSSTSVSYNGRIDLIAGYNAVPNPKYDPASTASDFTLALPFYYQSNVGNTPTGDRVENSGTITLGTNSVLQVLPETASTARVAGDLVLPSIVNIQGQSVHLEKDALILAPAAAVPLKKAYGFDGQALGAGVSVRAGEWFNPADTRYRFVHTDDRQQIYLDAGATIDVAGLRDVAASVKDNVVAVELRGAELADSPLQRDGPLRGTTIYVDLRQHGPWDPTLNGGLGGYTWVGTPLANTAGWIRLATHTVGQLATNGGSVSLDAGGAVVLQSGSAIDVSGGSIKYAADKILTTKLLAGSHLYDVSEATADRTYTGVVGGTSTTYDEKWGVTKSYTSALAQGVLAPGYTQGGSGGSIAIKSPVMALDGTLASSTVTGALQRNYWSGYNPAAPADPANPAASGVNRWLIDALSHPLAGQLALTVGREYLADEGNYTHYSPTPAHVVLGEETVPAAADAYDATGNYKFPTQRNHTLALSSELFAGAEEGVGFGLVKIDNSDDAGDDTKVIGDITVKSGASLDLGPMGSLILRAGNIGIGTGASIASAGGLIQLQASTLSTMQADRLVRLHGAGAIPAELLPVYNPLRGTVTVASDAVLDVTGRLIDDRPLAQNPGTVAQVTNGGTITVDASTIRLAAGSWLDVSGGGAFSSSGKLSYGDAGTINLNAGLAYTGDRPIGSVAGGRLELTGATLAGYAGTGRKGGTLQLRAPSVTVAALADGAATRVDATNGALTLAPDFFSQGGFTRYTVTGLGVATAADGSLTGARPAVTITDTAVVHATAWNWATVPGGDIFLADPDQRTAVQLGFLTTAPFADINGELLDNNDVSLTVAAKAVLATDPGGGVTLGGGSIDFLGRIESNGGTIALNQIAVGRINSFLPGVHLGTQSVLDASGATIDARDRNGLYHAAVLDGGSITVSGNIVAETGAVLDVSGAADTVWVQPAAIAGGVPNASGLILEPIRQESNGGRISLRGQQLLFTDATLQARSGGETARHGSVEVLSAMSTYEFLSPRTNAGGTTDLLPTATDRVLTLEAGHTDFVYGGLGVAVKDRAGATYGDAQGLGLVHFGDASLAGGGFGAITIGTSGRGAIEVRGEVALTASRQITLGDGGTVALGAGIGPKGAASALDLTAPYVVLGQPFKAPNETLAPEAVATAGPGRFAVHASALVDVGNLAIQGASTTVIDATRGGTTAGSIRGNGTLAVAGDLTLQAAQIYPPTASTFTVIASDYQSTVDPKKTVAGSVTIKGTNSTAAVGLPLSAGGTLNVYASTITQGGTLRAPLGQINLGRAQDEGAVADTTDTLPVTSSLVLESGSITSVSMLDPVTGKPVTIPYGINVNGDTWIDPTGTDITSKGPGAAGVSLAGGEIDLQAAAGGKAAARVDISGGGDLSAYQFIPGAGGSTDVLLNSGATTFAILPGYTDVYAPLAPYSTSSDAQLSLGSDPGYVFDSARADYRAGDQVHLEATTGLPAGNYTLLPARYALLPGAFLVTVQKDATTAGPAPAVKTPEGAVLTAGYRFNALEQGGVTLPGFQTFEIASGAVLAKRAEYRQFGANSFFTEAAAEDDVAAPRLPRDAGRLQLTVGSALQLRGTVAAAAATSGRGSLVDISSEADIVIGSAAVIAKLEAAGTDDRLLLGASQLSGLGAESLLIGGVRTVTTEADKVAVKTGSITVDNAGEALTGADIVLAANGSVDLRSGAEISAAGRPPIVADALEITGSHLLRDATGKNLISFARGGVPIVLPAGLPAGGGLTPSVGGTITTAAGVVTTFVANTVLSGLGAGDSVTLADAGTLTATFNTDHDPVRLQLGDGALVRVSSSAEALVTRTAVTRANQALVRAGAGVKLAGASVVLDSTNRTEFDPALDFSQAGALTLSSGQISVVLDSPGALPTDAGLVLSRGVQELLFKSARALSLNSYSNLDFYGSGAFGSATMERLGLQAGAIRNRPNPAGTAGTVAVAAREIVLGNALNATGSPVAGVAEGKLTLDSGTLRMGTGALELQNFTTVEATATQGVVTGGANGAANNQGQLLVRGGDLSITTPLLTGSRGSDMGLVAEGALKLAASSGAATVTPGLGATLRLEGKSVDLQTAIRLPSGNLAVTANMGDLTVTGDTLAVDGVAQEFFDVTRYTNAGQISLQALQGDLAVAAGSKLSVASANGGGAAGLLKLLAPQGGVELAAGTITGQGAAGYEAGSFQFDAAGADLPPLLLALEKGGFTRLVDLRLRQGDVVLDGAIRAHDFSLAADTGSIRINGTIDASGFAASAPGERDPVDPTGGTITLAAGGNVVLAPGSLLTAAGYAYGDDGKGGTISLLAGSYTHDGSTGHVNETAQVDVQAGARIDLGVKRAVTPNDLLLHAGDPAYVSNREDLVAGTLHVAESQAAFGSGSQFASLADSVSGAEAIILEGRHVFDLAGTNGAVTTSGGITTVGVAGVIDTKVQNAVRDNGTAFLAGVDSSLLTTALYHVRPGAELVNSTPVSSASLGNFVTLNNGLVAPKSAVNFTLKPGNGVFTTVLIPGGLAPGTSLRTSSTGRRFTVTTADGVTSGLITASATTEIKSASASNPIVAVNFQNTGGTALATNLNMFAGTVPVTLAFDTASPVTTLTAAGRFSAQAGDLVLANNWDLSGFRYGPKLEPGYLTLRTRGNLVFGFDASLSDGFAPATAATAVHPLWQGLLQTGDSSSLRLVAGADYGAADSRAVQPLATLAADRGSVLIGAGAVALPTTVAATVTKEQLVPRYYQTIRTGTGDLEIAAGRDVQFLNPLASVYTAGRAADAMAGFDLPVLDSDIQAVVQALKPAYPAQFGVGGGDLRVTAQNDIVRYDTSSGTARASSSRQMPGNWLYRRGSLADDGTFAVLEHLTLETSEAQSIAWWIDYSNFFFDTGTLGGGDVTLTAGRNVSNINAAAPTNARMPGRDATGATLAPDAAALVELGGGNIAVHAGRDIDAGVYYVERGQVQLQAGGAVKSNATRTALTTASTDPVVWLPTTLFLGKGAVDVTAAGDVRLGSIANPFWLPQGANNRAYETTFFSTMDPANQVDVSSLGGRITFQVQPDTASAGSLSSGASLLSWYNFVLPNSNTGNNLALPWLRMGTVGSGSFGYTAYLLSMKSVAAVLPATLRATAFSDDIDVIGSMTFAPAPHGTVELLAGGDINGLRVNGVGGIGGKQPTWGTAVLNLSDADPARLPGITTPISFADYHDTVTGDPRLTLFPSVNALFAESGRNNFSLEERLALHGSYTDSTGRTGPLHGTDDSPLRLYAAGGDLSGLTLYSAKFAQVLADQNLTDIALFMQNVRPGDVSVVAAGRDIIAYDPASALRRLAQQPGNILAGDAGATGSASGTPNTGDIQIAGPGSLQVLAGRNLELGSGSTDRRDGMAAGLTSVGATRNPYLAQGAGADIIALAGAGGIYTGAAVGQRPGLATTNLDFKTFIAKFLDPGQGGALATRYLKVLGTLLGLPATSTEAEVWAAYGFDSTKPLSELNATLALKIFSRVLRDAARDRNNPDSPTFGEYTNGFTAVAALFPGSPTPTKEDIESTEPVVRPDGPWSGRITMPTRLIKTFEGGNLTLLAPGGDITVGRPTDPQKPDQGILTERGGGIAIFAAGDVNVGTSRIFTLRGGDETIWSTWGNIAAGSGSKTVFSAPPTRVLIDPQSGDVQNDLAGLATGSGIGVLATLAGVQPGDIDLIAPVGTVDAGDAGIRSSGNLNIAARIVLNAANIQVGGVSVGTPPPVAAPNVGSLSAASAAATATSTATASVAKQGTPATQTVELPSLISVEVVGYGGGEAEESEDERKPQT